MQTTNLLIYISCGHVLLFYAISTNIKQVNTTDIIPADTPSSTGNTTAEKIGLHNFYQNSLWGYCEGYAGDTVTNCSHPSAGYSFDIVQIFQDELSPGQNVSIPSVIQDNHDKVHTASHWMFGLYIVGTIFIFLAVLMGFLALVLLFGSVLALFVSFLGFLFFGAATILAQVIFTIYRDAINISVSQLGVTANLGTTMFAFSWTATVCILVAFFGFCLGSCCGTSESGRRRYWRREKYYNP